MTKDTIETLPSCCIRKGGKELNIEWMLETLTNLKKSLKAINSTV